MTHSDKDVDAAIRTLISRPDDRSWVTVASYATPIMRAVLSRSYPALCWSTIDDIVSETLVGKVLPNLSRYDPDRAKFSTWLGTIALNHARDMQSKKENRVTQHVGTIYDNPDELDPASDANAATLSADEVVTVTMFCPFSIDVDTVQNIYAVFLNHGGVCTETASTLVEGHLRRAKVDYRDLSPNGHELTSFLFALIRQMKVEDSDLRAILTGVAVYPTTTPIGLIHRMFGREVAGKMVVMFGGAMPPIPPTARVAQAGRAQLAQWDTSTARAHRRVRRKAEREE